MPPQPITRDVLARWADDCALPHVGVARAGPLHREAAELAAWLAAGRHGNMSYLARNPERRTDPETLLPGCRSVVVAAVPYPTSAPKTPPGGGRIARYATVPDYHDVVKKRLEDLLNLLRQAHPGVRGKVCVDTSAILEKAWAERAGIGWRGKHTNLVSRRFGSWFFLGILLLDIDLPADEPHRDLCGKCNACLQACPTRALPAPRVLDARRCISYLTIENRGATALDLRPGVGDHIFGCDRCLDACPWNRFAPPLAAPGPAIDGNAAEILRCNEDALRRRIRGTPFQRAGVDGIRRNACVVLGNARDGRAREVLEHAAKTAGPLVAEHADWAISILPSASRPGNNSTDPA